MTFVKCCPSCENRHITAPRDPNISKIKTKTKTKIDAEQRKEMQDIWRRRLLRDVQAACKRAKGHVKAFEPKFVEKKHYQL